jgi:YD repeat-containing protein
MDYTRDKVGRLTSASGATFQYDASGRLTASNGLLIAHDPVGRVSQVTLAPGNVVQYSYDRRGLCTQVKDWTGATVTLQYDDASRLISISRPNGVTTNYRYDADSDVAGIQEAGSGNTLSSISLTRDQRGLIVQASRNVPASPTPDQLASVQTQHTFNAADQVAEFQYDAMGRRVADDTRSYTWDLASRLTGHAGSSGSSALLQYDGVGLLNEQTTGGVTFQFVWNHALYIPSASVVRWGGSDLLYFIHTPDGQLLASVDTNGVHHYYH